MKIAWFTEIQNVFKVHRNHENMRNDMAWMHVLDASHYPINSITEIESNKYDIGIVTIPKNPKFIDQLRTIDTIKELKRVCKKVGTMQEGPHWYFQDYSMENQIWFYNLLVDLDFIWCHNELDRKYFKGITRKKCYVNPTLMIEDNITPHIVNPDARDGVIIGGNMCRWYGGFDSYVVDQKFDEEIFAPSMGRKIDREDEMDISHLPYMNWLEWMNNLSRFKYAVHLMPTQAAGTFTLNCAYHGIPCIGYKGLDTQEHLHPSLSVDYGDLDTAVNLAQKLKKDTEFYEKCSKECKALYEKSSFREKSYIYTMNKVIGEVINETN